MPTTWLALQRISALVDAGINLAGIARILSLEDDNAALHAANPAAEDEATRKIESS